MKLVVGAPFWPIDALDRQADYRAGITLPLREVGPPACAEPLAASEEQLRWQNISEVKCSDEAVGIAARKANSLAVSVNDCMGHVRELQLQTPSGASLPAAGWFPFDHLNNAECESGQVVSFDGAAT